MDYYILQTLNVRQDLTFADLQGFFGLNQHISISHHTARLAKQKKQLLCQLANEAEHRYVHTAPLHDAAEMYFSIHRQPAVFFKCWIPRRWT